MFQIMRPALTGIAVVVALAACKDTGAQYEGGEVDRAGERAVATNDSAIPSSPVVTMWSSPVIFGFAETANKGEVQLGKLASKKATSPDVKAFARLMVTDHSAMNAATMRLASKLSIVADTKANAANDLANQERGAFKELTDKPAGANWDKDYMDKMVAGHQEVLNKLQDAERSTTDAGVRAALQSSIAKVQTHLTKAQEVRGKLQ